MGPLGPMMTKTWIRIQRDILGESGEKLYVILLPDGSFMLDSADTAVMAWRVFEPAQREAEKVDGRVMPATPEQYKKLNSVRGYSPGWFHKTMPEQ